MNPRRCVACRKALLAERMTRVVRRPDLSIVIDEQGHEQGRGAYLCFDPRCMVLARKKDLLTKALGVPVPETIYDQLQNMRDEVEVLMKTEIHDLAELFGLARRCGDLVIGQDRVLEVVSTSGYQLFLTVDAPQRLKEKYERMEQNWIVLPFSRYDLGKALGLHQAVTVALSSESGFLRKVAMLLPKGGIELE